MTIALSTNNGSDANPGPHCLQVEFDTPFAHIVKYYTLDEDTLRQARLWQAAQEIPPTPQQFADWLEQNGVPLDRADGPAFIVIADGIRIEEWFRNGRLDRADGPAIIATYKDGTRIEEWFRNGQRDRTDGPAIIVTFEDGTRIEQWWTEGEFIKEKTTAPPLSIPGVTLDPPPAPPQP